MLDKRDNTTIIKAITYILMYVALFLILCLRSPIDFATPYMWGEDGMVLYEEAAVYGIGTLFATSNGTFWVLQRLIGYIVYTVLYSCNALNLLPAGLSVITKLVETFAFFYFTTDRFKRIVKSRWARFFIAVSLILAIPDNAVDLINCDTSSPFILIFVVFLIGFNAFFNHKTMTLSEGLFLILMGFSSAAVPFIVGVAFLCLILFLYYNKGRPKTKKFKVYLWIHIIVCLATVLAFVVQVISIISYGRTSGVEFDLPGRLWNNLLYWVWIPYSNYYKVDVVVIALIVGIALWIVLTFISRIKPIVAVYSAAFSFAFSLMCSMAFSVSFYYNPEAAMTTISGRFWSLPYQIAAFFLGVAICRMWHRYAFRIFAIAFIVIESSILLPHYPIKELGTEEKYIDIFNSNVASLDVDGGEFLEVCIGPWDPFCITLPIELDDESISCIEDVTGEIGIAPQGHYVCTVTVPEDIANPIKEAYLSIDNGFRRVGMYSIDRHNDGTATIEFCFLKLTTIITPDTKLDVNIRR